MHKIIKSYLRKFTQDHELGDLEESIQFEYFVNFCILSKYYPDSFEIEEVTTSPDDDSIDGAAVLIDDQLALTVDATESILRSLPKRRNATVQYLFFQAKRSEGFDAGDILKFGTAVSRLFDDEQNLPNDDLLKEIRGIHEVIIKNIDKVENGRPECRLFYACTGIWREENNLRKQLEFCESCLQTTGFFSKIEFSPIDREGIVALWNNTRSPVEATFEVRGSILPFPQIAQVEEAYIAIVLAKSFIQDVLTDKDGRIRNSIFEQNVRAFLGDDNPVNQRIRQSLEDPRNHDCFAILNNGITIVAPEVRIQSNRIFIRNFQVVNGCQTSHVLFRNKDLVSDQVWLPVRIIQAEDSDVVAKVVEATNSQSDVEQSQFLSIRPFVRKIEAYFDSYDGESEIERRIYFERRTMQYADQRLGQKRQFDIQRLARAFAAMFMDVPHLALRYPTQTFQEKANELYQPGHREIAYYASALTLYRLELAFANSYISRDFQKYKWHILMICKYQAGGMEMPPLDARKLDKYCDKIVDQVAPSSKGSAPIFVEATKVIEKLGDATRDRLKRQAYTTEILNQLRSKS